jgi:hypothetical protein
MNIGVLYICTGKYNVFWAEFYKSSKKYFFSKEKSNVHYFVFTDDFNINSTDEITIIKTPSNGFPKDSLYRFELFTTHKKKFLNIDYLFFFNSNMVFLDYVGAEILPKKENGFITATLHPGYYSSGVDKYPYERNPESTAFIPIYPDISYKYYMGGLNGGKVKEFLKLCKTCHLQIKKDDSKGVLAIFHDESHLNKYLYNKNPLALPIDYGMPEDSNLLPNPKLLILNKSKHHGRYFIKKYPENSNLPIPYFVRRNILMKLFLFIVGIWKRK